MNTATLENNCLKTNIEVCFSTHQRSTYLTNFFHFVSLCVACTAFFNRFCLFGDALLNLIIALTVLNNNCMGESYSICTTGGKKIRKIKVFV